jgi:hypothetical protein
MFNGSNLAERSCRFQTGESVDHTNGNLRSLATLTDRERDIETHRDVSWHMGVYLVDTHLSRRQTGKLDRQLFTAYLDGRLHNGDR